MSEEDKKEGNVSFTFKKNTLWKVGTFVFAALFVISLLTGGFGLNSGGIAAGNNNAANVPAPSAGQVKVQINSDDPVLGNKNADVAIVEFSDFQCPFCGRANDDALAQFKQSDYFTSGKVNLIYKNFPLNSIHPWAQKAAEAAECANTQGKFWEYHDVLFANQGALDVASLKTYAQQVGLDTTKFNKCLDGSEEAASISKDLSQATSAGGQGTPYFVIINTKTGETQPVSGAVPWSNFEAAINAVM